MVKSVLEQGLYPRYCQRRSVLHFGMLRNMTAMTLCADLRTGFGAVPADW